MKPAPYLIVLFMAGCGAGRDTGGQAGLAGNQATKGVGDSQMLKIRVFDLVRADGSTQAFSLDDLKKLPLATIFAEGNPQEGPSLAAVLKSAAVADFQEVAITGREGTKRMNKAEITQEVILDFNNRGSVKLVSPTMPHEARIRDITRIEVR
ncbi:MAG: hypothetical protein ACKO0V_05460 [bacterium]